MLKNNNIFCDVDETLVREVLFDETPDVEFVFNGCLFRKKVNYNLIEKLKEKSKTVFIIIWTSNSLGSEYAETIIDIVGLRQFIDVVLFKPTKIIDDSPIFDWYLNQEKPNDF